MIMRKFNTAGLCIPEKDYMVDISEKLTRIKELIDTESYFTINRARQFGKTTILSALERLLQDEYVVASISFEGLGDESFQSVDLFCNEFMELIREARIHVSPNDDTNEKWVNTNVTTFRALGKHITEMCRGKKVVLMIDEVDKTSNNQIFLNFLSMLRSKFLARKGGKDHTFHSVILVGVYDIKNIKLKMIQDGTHLPSEGETKIYNSPWNIAIDFEIDMSFNPAEISTMLSDYEADNQIGLNIKELANEIYDYTDGYPYLVSKLCKHIDEKLSKTWTADSVRSTVQTILKEKNTLFDDIYKNLENNKKLYELIHDILIVGKRRLYSIGNPTVDLGVIYGIIKESNSFVSVSNRVFEMLICDYFISKDEENNRRITGVLQNDVIRNGIFDMELCLRKFSEFYSEIFNKHDISFLEEHGRLLFLAFLKPLVNGQGFFHIESQFTDLRRMDIVVDFGQKQFILELKLWRGKKYQAEAFTQLCGYLESKHADTGYMLTFDFRKEANKVRKTEWIKVNDKRIFSVIV